MGAMSSQEPALRGSLRALEHRVGSREQDGRLPPQQEAQRPRAPRVPFHASEDRFGWVR